MNDKHMSSGVNKWLTGRRYGKSKTQHKKTRCIEKYLGVETKRRSENVTVQIRLNCRLLYRFSAVVY